MSDDDYVFSYTTGEKMPEFKKTKEKKNSRNSNKIKYSANDGIIRIAIEKNKRGGKQVSIIYGFERNIDIKSLSKELKNKLGTGGTAKSELIEIQGDHREKIKTFLIEKGYKVKLAGG